MSGYNISYNDDEIQNEKLKFVLDNGALSYLLSKTDQNVLDYSNEGIDLTKYRHSYLKNRFSTYEISDIDNDNILEFIGIQNLLYLNNNEKNIKLQNTLGKVKSVFTIQDYKLVIKNTIVEK